MDVANLELCKELYDLSGWSNTTHLWWPAKWTERKTHDVVGLHVNAEDISHEILADLIPAYDLGYLLRKLPGVKLEQIDKDYWNAQKFYDDGTELLDYKSCDADTPEDAVAKLCCALLKSGVLPSERKTAKPQASPKELQ